jgi:acetyltransferase
VTRSGEADVLAPHLVPEVHAEGFGSLWVAVSRAGGAVGFVPDSPEEEIRAAVLPVVEAVRAGREHMIAIGADDAPVGTVFVRPGATPRVAHRGDVVRLMVRPDLQRRGLGRTLLEAAVAHATALGLEQLLLSARGGTHLPAYYARLGWTEAGVWPGALRLGEGDDRDEHWFQLRIS